MIFDSFRARIGVVLITNGQILLVRNTRKDPPTFHLPGDIVKVNETLEQAAKRAVKEQAGIDVEVQKLLYVRDGLDAEKHRLDLFFLGKIGKEQDTLADHPNFKIDWVNIGIMESMDLFPKFLRRRVLKDYKNKFKDTSEYVGALE